MATKTDQTGKFADHIQKTLDLVFEVNADSGSISSDLPGAASFTDAAAGQFDVDLSELGDVEKVLEATVTPSAGTATIASAIASKALTLSIDSTLNLSSGSGDFVIRVAVKREL